MPSSEAKLWGLGIPFAACLRLGEKLDAWNFNKPGTAAMICRIRTLCGETEPPTFLNKYYFMTWMESRKVFLPIACLLVAKKDLAILPKTTAFFASFVMQNVGWWCAEDGPMPTSVAAALAAQAWMLCTCVWQRCRSLAECSWMWLSAALWCFAFKILCFLKPALDKAIGHKSSYICQTVAPSVLLDRVLPHTFSKCQHAL